MDTVNEAALLALMERTGYPMLQVSQLPSHVPVVVYRSRVYRLPAGRATQVFKLLRGQFRGFSPGRGDTYPWGENCRGGVD